ncbi:hypothetical protein [Motilibacter peucedani]|nr:hypothetical protein [Motilibacter peucedani]
MSHSVEQPRSESSAQDPLDTPYVRRQSVEDAWDTLGRVALVVGGAVFVIAVAAYGVVLGLAVNGH